MTDASLNIVDLIENNPITRLSQTYQSNLLTKIKAKFTDIEQQMFVASFYCYLNYSQKNDFVIDLDNVWKWLGFNQKVKAKVLLEKHFVIDIDYKTLLSQPGKQCDHTKGGHNKEIFVLSIKTFKLFCLKAGTKKAEQIHDYYINLEDILQEIMREESNELRLQLEQKTKELTRQLLHSDGEKEKIREKTLLEQFPSNTQCVYYGFIDNVSDKGERLIKFGNSNNLKNRVQTHKKTYLNFRLTNAFKVDNKLQIETALKNHLLFKERQYTLTLSSKKYVELLNIEELPLTELDKAIKEIITRLEYSPENYIKLLDENRHLKLKLESANVINQTEQVFILQTENARLKLENLKLIKRYKSLCKYTRSTPVEQDLELEDSITITRPVITGNEIHNYGNVITTLRKNSKNKAGTYDINGKNYPKLEGTRQEVWDGIAYQTSGALRKNDFLINKNGLIVSKRKSISETQLNRLLQCGVNKPVKASNQVIESEL